MLFDIVQEWSDLLCLSLHMGADSNNTLRIKRTYSKNEIGCIKVELFVSFCLQVIIVTLTNCIKVSVL